MNRKKMKKKQTKEVQKLFNKTFSKRDVESLVEQRINKTIALRKKYSPEAKRKIKKLNFRLKCYRETIKELRNIKEVPKVIYKTKYKTKVKEVPIYFPNLNYLQFITFGIVGISICITLWIY